MKNVIDAKKKDGLTMPTIIECFLASMKALYPTSRIRVKVTPC